MRALIVDDEPLACKVVSLCLPKDAECDIALDGREAFEAFKRAFESGRRHDVVILDFLLPEMDGLEVRKLIRGFEDENGVAPSSQAVIIFTSSTAEVACALEHASDRVASVAKPVSAEKLRTVLSRLGLANLSS